MLIDPTDICQTSEEMSPEDRAAELLPIAVQYLYVLIRQGKTEEAESLLNDITVEKYVASLSCNCSTSTDNNPVSLNFPQRKLRGITLPWPARHHSTPTSSTKPSTRPQKPSTTTDYLTFKTTPSLATRTQWTFWYTKTMA